LRLQVLALLASLAGLGISIYLTGVHYSGVPLACPASGAVSCEAVLSSSYAVLGGTQLPTSAAGILWFAVSAVLWTRPAGRIQLAWAAVGLVAALYLVYVEIVRVGAICLWCSGAHALVLLIFLIALPRPQGDRVGL
jgi:uncharacterized membrane protein